MKTNSKLLMISTLVYIYLPILIFLTGFTKVWVWLITIPVCGYAILKMYKDYIEDIKGVTILINWKYLLLATIIIELLCVALGFGGIFYEAGDWPKHNAVLHDLVEKSWPVYYTSYEQTMLTYYLGQYLVPALIGKAGVAFGGNGFEVSSTAMGIWGVIGVVLVYMNLVRVTKSNTLFKQIRCLVIMFFFCGALPLAQILTYGLYGEEHMYSLGNRHWLLYEGFNVQFRSNLVMLRWVFPQVIVIWLIVLLLMEHRKHANYYVILITPILFFGTFSILYMVIAAAVCAIISVAKSEKKPEALMKIFSATNVCSFATLGLILIFYFLGYLQVEKPEYMSFQLKEVTWTNIWGVIIFYICMVGIYLFCVFREQKRNPLFYTCAVFLFVILFFFMGIYNDIVMCASIPALFMVMCWVIEYCNNTKDTKAYGMRVGIITILLAIGAIYPTVELRENVRAYCVDHLGGVADYFGSLERYSDRKSDEAQDLVYNYFTYDLQGKTFYEVIARKKITD